MQLRDLSELRKADKQSVGRENLLCEALKSLTCTLVPGVNVAHRLFDVPMTEGLLDGLSWLPVFSEPSGERMPQIMNRQV